MKAQTIAILCLLFGQVSMSLKTKRATEITECSNPFENFLTEIAIVVVSSDVEGTDITQIFKKLTSCLLENVKLWIGNFLEMLAGLFKSKKTQNPATPKAPKPATGRPILQGPLKLLDNVKNSPISQVLKSILTGGQEPATDNKTAIQSNLMGTVKKELASVTGILGGLIAETLVSTIVSQALPDLGSKGNLGLVGNLLGTLL